MNDNSENSFGPSPSGTHSIVLTRPAAPIMGRRPSAAYSGGSSTYPPAVSPQTMHPSLPQFHPSLTLPPLRSNAGRYLTDSERLRVRVNELMDEPAYLSRQLVSQLIFPEHSTH